MRTSALVALVALAAVAAEPQERCGCAREVFKKDPSLKSCDAGTKDACGDCGGGPYGCPSGSCPFPGAYRDGFCHEPGGTHKVCAVVTKELETWFQSVGNDLSSVVHDGGGWCLCKHWTRGALCCHQNGKLLSPGAIRWTASDLVDEEVLRIKSYVLVGWWGVGERGVRVSRAFVLKVLGQVMTE